MRRASLLVAVAILAAAPAYAEPPSWSLKLEAGTEYDTNIHRFEVAEDSRDQVAAAPLGRVGARYRLRSGTAASGLLSLAAYAGARMFASEAGQSENIAVLQGDASYLRRLEQRSVLVGVRGGYYDAIEYNPFGVERVTRGRAFSTAAAEGVLTVLGPPDHRVTATAGYRGFRYKPDPDVDWHGDQYGLLYQATAWRGDPDADIDAASIEVSAGYRLGRRQYAGSAFMNACPEESPDDPRCFVPSSLGRADLHHALAAEVVYTGERIWSARYELHVNDSNSFGQSLVRQRLEVKLTSELFGSGLFLTASGAVLLNVFLDPLLLARDVQSQTFVSIDDENRNSLSLHLSRDLGQRWAAEARYAIYSNEFATRELSFRRQTFYAGLVYNFSGHPR